MNHPFLASLHYAFEGPAHLFLVMDFAVGGDLGCLQRRFLLRALFGRAHADARDGEITRVLWRLAPGGRLTSAPWAGAQDLGVFPSDLDGEYVSGMSKRRQEEVEATLRVRV